MICYIILKNARVHNSILSGRSVILSEKCCNDVISPIHEASVVAGHSVIHSHSSWEDFRTRDWNLIVMAAGGGKARMDNASLSLAPGTVYLFAPMQKRRFYTTGGWVSWWMHFPLHTPLKWPELLPGELYALTPPPVEFRRCLRDVMEGVRVAVGCRVGWQLLALNLAHNVILRGNMLAGAAMAERRLLRAETMLGDFSKPVNMDQVASACGMSRSVFYARFREAYGLPPRVWREQRQLNALRSVLETTTLPLSELCAQFGIYDMSQFFKRFKHCFGITPAQCRRQAAVR